VIIRLNLHFASHNPLYIDCQSQELGGSVHYQDPPSKLLRLIISLNGNLLSLSNIGLTSPFPLSNGQWGLPIGNIITSHV